MFRKTPQIILAFLTIVLLSGMYSIVSAQQKREQKKKENKETYVRPEPKKSLQPTIPKENRYQEDKVFLENADSLYRPPHDMEERQIVKGEVQFRQGGMYMFCDSAYYWPTRNSMDAFGHVLMKQGDTLFVYADKLYYDGMTRHAILVNGPSQREVVMKNRQVTLTTDSLDYDVVQDLGWYNVGGKLVDGVNTLTSQYGQYSPTTKIADFRGDVVLVNNKDGYKLYTEELKYNTSTAIADINTETLIEGENDTIITTQGWYNTRTDNANLTARSTILHRDSAGNVVTLEGDSLIYDKAAHLSEAYMFRSIYKRARPMVLTDTARKMQLVGGFGRYNDLLQEAMATEFPLLIEYSRADTLFLRADTILTFQRTEKVWPDSLAHPWSKETRERLAAYQSLEDMFDVMDLSILLLPHYIPMPGAGGTSPAKLDSDEDSDITDVPDNEMDPEIEDNLEVVDNQQGEAEVGDESFDNYTDNSPADSIPVEALPLDSIAEMPERIDSIMEVPERVDSIKPSGPRLDKLGRDSTFMVDKNYHAAKAIGKARFFKSDLQGIADTILYHQYDSMLYLQRRPVVWSEERQIFGDTIKVHLIDSVADWAHLPVGGMVIEHIDDDFYNQLSGSEIKAFLRDSQLDHLVVSGNVEAIFLPMDNDSTYSKLVYAESSYLTVDMDGKEMKRLKMWPEVDGTVSPVFLVKKNEDKYLQGFRWLEMLRPRRVWYGDRMKWEDELGDVPDELIEYFGVE